MSLYMKINLTKNEKDISLLTFKYVTNIFF